MARTVKSSELRTKRAELESKIKGEVEKDSLTAEQRTAINAMVTDSNNLKEQYEMIERSDEVEKELRASSGKPAQAQSGEKSVLSDDATERKAQVSKAFRSFLKNGKADMPAEERAILEAEKRTYAPLQVANPAAGYFVPQGFSYEFDEALKQTGGMIEACRNYATDSGNPLLWPMVDDTANKAVIVGEGQSFTGLNPTVTHLTLGAYKYGTLVQATTEQMEDSAFDIEKWLKDEFVVRFERGVNYDLTNGNGTTAPKGIVNCISTTVTSTSDNPGTLIYDDLVDTLHSTDPSYRRDKSCKWMCNDDTVRAIRLIKDAYGHPIFQTDPTGNLPDRILGFEHVVNQDLPIIGSGSPPASGPVVLFGAFNRYVVRKVNGLMVQRLNERYAELGLVGFLGWARYDGNLVTASATAIVGLHVY